MSGVYSTPQQTNMPSLPHTSSPYPQHPATRLVPLITQQGHQCLTAPPVCIQTTHRCSSTTACSSSSSRGLGCPTDPCVYTHPIICQPILQTFPASFASPPWREGGREGGLRPECTKKCCTCTHTYTSRHFVVLTGPHRCPPCKASPFMATSTAMPRIK